MEIRTTAELATPARGVSGEGGRGKSWLAKINPSRNSSINPDIRPLIHVNTPRPPAFEGTRKEGGYYVINDWPPLLLHLLPWTLFILSVKFVLFGIITIHRKQLVVGIRTNSTSLFTRILFICLSIYLFYSFYVTSFVSVAFQWSVWCIVCIL